MIIGNVSEHREAVIELEILTRTKRTRKVSAVIDTGFNGYLTLPGNLITRLKLQLAGNRLATIGDGNVVLLDVYLAKMLWHGREREVLVLQTEGGPLAGMSLLYGNRLIVDVVEGGEVMIDPLMNES